MVTPLPDTANIGYPWTSDPLGPSNTEEKERLRYFEVNDFASTHCSKQLFKNPQEYEPQCHSLPSLSPKLEPWNHTYLFLYASPNYSVTSSSLTMPGPDISGPSLQPNALVGAEHVAIYTHAASRRLSNTKMTLSLPF